MHQNRWQLEFRPTPYRRNLQRSPNAVAGFKGGPTSNALLLREEGRATWHDFDELFLNVVLATSQYLYNVISLVIPSYSIYRIIETEYLY